MMHIHAVRKVVGLAVLGLCAYAHGSIQESFITVSGGNETISTHTTESPLQMAASPAGSGLTWGGYSQASASAWQSNVGIQGGLERFILYSANNDPSKTANYEGTYIYTIFNMSGGTTPEVTLNLALMRAYIQNAAPGQQVRWLLRDSAGQWFLSDDITTISTLNTWYDVDPSAISWLRVNSAAENEMNQLDAGPNVAINDPATLSSQSVDVSQITGGGMYIEQGTTSSGTPAFIMTDINWISVPEPVDLYVATDGDNGNPGTMGSPLATLEGARDKIRADGLAANGVTVHIRGGAYRLTSSFSLSSQDSGLPGLPVVYQAFQDEEVILHGAEFLSPADFSVVTDPALLARLPASTAGNILECDLAALGIVDYGQLLPASDSPTAPAELFFNERPMTLAQWPNEGFTLSGNVIQTGSQNPDVGSIFEYTDEHIEGWGTFSNVWVGGHWGVEMFDSMRIQAVDTVANTIETVLPPITWGGVDLRNDRRMFFINVLDELDVPTEYYIDRDTGKLYFYPPDLMPGATLQLSMLADEMISLNNVSDVQFKNLVFEAGRHRAIGTSSSSDLGVFGCTFRNLGKNAITCWLGENITISECDFYETGDGGVRTFGGDRETLAPGNHVVENCHFYNYSRLRRTGSSPARLERVGHTARHNLAHGNWRGGFSFPGNNHLYEFNEVNNILKNSNDTSSIGSGFDWAGSGTHIRYNFIHNYHGVPSHSIIAVGVYMDDGLSGNQIYKNVFYDIDMAFFSHGGRGTVVDNNLMIDCPRSFNFMDPSQVNWWGSRFTTLSNKITNLYDLDPPNVRALYESQYPHLVTLNADLDANALDPNNLDYQLPKENVGTKNLIYNSGAPEIPANVATYGTFSNNYEMAAGQDAGFNDPAALDFGLRPDAPTFTLIPGFEDIPFEQIGLYTNASRPALPALGDFKLFLPADTAPITNAAPVEFVWESCPFADEYVLEIATDPDFASMVVSTNKEDMCYSYAAVTVNGLSPSQTYYWRVKAFTNARSMERAETSHSGPDSFILNGPRHPYATFAHDSPTSYDLNFQNLSPQAYYELQQTTNLMSVWEHHSYFTSSLDGMYSVESITNNSPNMFYRLKR